MIPELPDTIKNRSWTTKEVMLLVFLIVVGAVEYMKYQGMHKEMVETKDMVKELRIELYELKQMYYADH